MLDQTSHNAADPTTDTPCGTAAGTPAADLRTDARRNRERVVKAAREVFAAQGVDATLPTRCSSVDMMEHRHLVDDTERKRVENGEHAGGAWTCPYRY